MTANLSAASWGPGDAEPLPGGADPPAVETVVEVDEDDPPCMDIYTSGAIRVADATFIFPMMYLHCNTGRSVAVGGRAFPVSAPIPCAPYRPMRPLPCAPFPTCSGLMATNDGLLDVGFAASRDGRTFERFDRAPFLPRGPGQPRTGCAAEQGGIDECRGVWSGEFDAGSTNVAVGYMDRGEEETLMIGHGSQFTHGGMDPGTPANTTVDGRPWLRGPVLSGLQLLTLRRHLL